MTDNGSAAGAGVFNAGMKGKKGNPNEGGTRVPAFFRWNSVLKEGVDVDRLTAHIDMYPTLAELAGAKLPAKEQVEGRSLVPLLKDPTAKWKDRFLFTHVGRWPKGANQSPKRCSKLTISGGSKRDR
jgi:arylsulfatase